MSIILDTPQVQTQTVTEFVITKIINNVERGLLSISYNLLLEDGNVLKEETKRFRGKGVIQGLYAELDTIIATGKTFEEASRELLYSKLV